MIKTYSKIYNEFIAEGIPIEAAVAFTRDMVTSMPFLSVEDASVYIGLSRTHLDKALNLGTIPTFKFGSRKLVRKSDLEGEIGTVEARRRSKAC